MEDVAHRDVSSQRSQARIQRQLVERVRARGDSAVVAGRQDVPSDVRLRGAGHGRDAEREEEGDRSEEATDHARARATPICAQYPLHTGLQLGTPPALVVVVPLGFEVVVVCLAGVEGVTGVAAVLGAGPEEAGVEGLGTGAAGVTGAAAATGAAAGGVLTGAAEAWCVAR